MYSFIVSCSLFFLFAPLSASAQDAAPFGIGLAWHTEKGAGLSVSYQKGHLIACLGYSRQHDGGKKIVKEQLPNYGRTVIGEGAFYSLVDLGLGVVLFRERLALLPEASIGSRNRYTTYSDDRFRKDGYSLITRRRSIAGLGCTASYALRQIHPFLGYNALKGFIAGLRFTFDQ